MQKYLLPGSKSLFYITENRERDENENVKVKWSFSSGKLSIDVTQSGL